MLPVSSPFLYALGWAIINSLWQTGLLWMIYKFIFSIHNRATAREKNGASTLLLFVSFAWFLWSLTNKYFEARLIVLNAAEQYSYLLQAKQSLSKNGWSSTTLNLLFESILPYLSVAYLLVLMALLTRLISSYRFTNRLRTQGLQKMEVEWKLYIQRMCGWISIRKEVKIYLSELIDVPATIGYLKPVILLPIATFSQLSTKQVEAIILHELAHIKRSDYLINIIISVVETILFFNPFVKLFTKTIRREREHSCDDFVLQFSYQPAVYAEALLTLEKSRIINHQYALAATGKDNDLLTRVKRILNIPHQQKIRNNFHVLALLLISAGLFSMAWVAPVKASRMTSSKTRMAAPQNYQRISSENSAVKQLPDIVLLSRKPEPKVKPASSVSGNFDVFAEAPLDAAENVNELYEAPQPAIALHPADIRLQLKEAGKSVADAQQKMKKDAAYFESKELARLTEELNKKQAEINKTMKEVDSNLDKYFVWDYEVQNEKSKIARKRSEELRQQNMVYTQRLNRAKEFQQKAEEFQKNFKLEPMQEMQKAYSGMHQYGPQNFRFEFNTPVYVEKQIELKNKKCLEDEQGNNGKDKLAIRIYNNGTLVFTVNADGRVESKLYKVERKAPKAAARVSSDNIVIAED